MSESSLLSEDITMIGPGGGRSTDRSSPNSTFLHLLKATSICPKKYNSLTINYLTKDTLSLNLT